MMKTNDEIAELAKAFIAARDRRDAENRRTHETSIARFHAGGDANWTPEEQATRDEVDDAFFEAERELAVACDGDPEASCV